MTEPLPVEQLAYKPITATGAIARRLDHRASEPYVSVLDFAGVVGDGTHDDTDGIERAINATFPQHVYVHQGSLKGNRVLYFPPGGYRTSRPLFAYSTAGLRFAGGGPLATFLFNGSLPDTVTASISGINTTGLDGINAQYRAIMTVTSVAAGTLYPGTIISGAGIAVGSVISGQLTGTPGGAGTYKVVPTQAVGPVTITGSNTTTFACQGTGYSSWEDMTFDSYSGIAFDWLHDNTGSFAPQICLWKHCTFNGVTTAFRAGVGGPQCDTSTWLDCLWGGADIGIDFLTQNTIGNSIVGGNITGCGIGVHAAGGSCASISGLCFQGSTTWDISIEGGFNDAYLISGISTESANFFHCGSPQAGATLIGCGQRNATAGVFAESSSIGMLNIIGCMTQAGKVTAGNPLTITGSIFYRNDALDDYIASVQHDSIGLINNSYFGGMLANRIIRQKITTAGRRTYDLEATTLTDAVVLYDSYGIGTGQNHVDCSVSSASPGVISFGGYPHYLLADQPVAFHTNGGSMPTGITANTTYYVSSTSLAAATFTLRTQPGGAGSAVNTSTTGSNVRMRLVRKWAAGDQLAKSNVAAGGSPGWVCTTAGAALTTAGPAAVFKAMANVAA